MQHALRAFTPRDQKTVKEAAQIFQANSKLNTEKVITEQEVSKTLVSVLNDKGFSTKVIKGSQPFIRDCPFFQGSVWN